MDEVTKADIKQLNSFLRGELAAVETYRQCIEKIREPILRQELEDLRRSHEQRVDVLQRHIRQLGGRPETHSGVWGKMARLLEGSARMFGPNAAISMLEEGEDHGRDDYNRDLAKLSPQEQEFVRARILPEQRKSHEGLSRLHHAL